MAYLAENIKIEANFAPFMLADNAQRMRSVETIEGIGDRLRAVAFAEISARTAFQWAYDTFSDASSEWRSEWLDLAAEENRHAQRLLDRMEEMGVVISERIVSRRLLDNLCRAETAESFQFLISSSEKRGMEIGLSMSGSIEKIDPISAAVFREIAEEEQDHIHRAEKFLVNSDLLSLKKAVQNRI